MKRIFTLLSLVFICSAANAQRLLSEDFNYLTGQLTNAGGGANVSGGKWQFVTGQEASPFVVTAGNLAYLNYFSDPTATSNKVSFRSVPATVSSQEDAYVGFTAPVTTGTVYNSFLFKLTSADASNLQTNASAAFTYFAGLLPSTSSTGIVARVYVRQGATTGTINFGISAASLTGTPAASVIQWIGTNYTFNTTHLVTVAYTIVTGANNDVAKLWVDAPFSATEPAAMASSVYSGGTEPTDIGRFFLRQGDATTPFADVDAIKASTTYADATLPLSLTSFKASLININSVQLNWITATEQNVLAYTIERSNDARIFSSLGEVAALNRSQASYSYTDTKALPGLNYYRLKMTDKDGAVKYSGVVSVSNRKGITASIFPNPVVGNMSVSHIKATKGASFKILNAEGRQIKLFNVEEGAVQTSLSVNELPKGNYLLLFENNGDKLTTKFIKQ